MQDGRASSHFLCLLLQVRQPVLTLDLLARVLLGLNCEDSGVETCALSDDGDLLAVMLVMVDAFRVAGRGRVMTRDLQRNVTQLHYMKEAELRQSLLQEGAANEWRMCKHTHS